MRRSGFTLVELLVCIGILAMLVAISFPALRSVRSRASAVQCQSNLRELFVAQLQYSQAHRGRFTPIVQGGDRWEQLLAPYVTRAGQLPRELMHCPSSAKLTETSLSARLYSSYGLTPALQMVNWNYRRDTRMDTARIILMADKADHAADDFLTTSDGWFMLADDRAGQWWRYTTHNPRGALRHGSGAAKAANALMADGHVTALAIGELKRDSGHWYWGGIHGMPTFQVAGGCCP